MTGFSGQIVQRFTGQIRSGVGSQLIAMMSGFALASFISACASALIIPLYTRTLTPAQYGTVDVVQTLVLIAASLAAMGVDHSLPALFHKPEFEQKSGKLISTTLRVISLISGTLAIIVAVASPIISERFFLDGGLWYLILIGCVTVFSLPLQSVVTSVLKLQIRPKQYVLVSAIGTATLLVSAFALVAGLHAGPAGVLASASASVVAVSLAGMFLIKPYLGERFDRSTAEKVLSVGVRVMPAGLLWVMLLNVDRLILIQFVPTSELGIYTVANKIANFVLLFTLALFGAWIPVALKKLATPSMTGNMRRTSELIVVVLLSGVIAIALFSQEMVKFASPAYADSAQLIPLLLVFNGPCIVVYSMLTLGAYTSGRVYFITIATALALLTNVVVNIIAIPSLGITGSAVATAAAGLVLLLTMWLLTFKIKPIPMLVMPIGTLAIVILFAIYTFGSSIDTFAEKMLVFMAFPLISCALLFASRTKALSPSQQ
jgi:O-antigen/teichoic acid export membrane protein